MQSESHLALEGLVSHGELDEGTGVAGHLLTRLQRNKSHSFTNILGQSVRQHVNVLKASLTCR